MAEKNQQCQIIESKTGVRNTQTNIFNNINELAELE